MLSLSREFTAASTLEAGRRPSRPCSQLYLHLGSNGNYDMTCFDCWRPGERPPHASRSRGPNVSAVATPLLQISFADVILLVKPSCGRHYTPVRVRKVGAKDIWAGHGRHRNAQLGRYLATHLDINLCTYLWWRPCVKPLTRHGIRFRVRYSNESAFCWFNNTYQARLEVVQNNRNPVLHLSEPTLSCGAVRFAEHEDPPGKSVAFHPP